MAFAANAQTNTLYFMEDVPKNTSWNPAFMPRYSGYISLFDIYGEVGNNAMMLRDFVFKRNGRWTTAFSPSESIDELYRRIGGNINGDVRFGLSILNFGFRIKEKNFFTFGASLRGEAYSHIPKDFTRLLLYGTGREDSFDFSSAGLEAKLYGELGFGFIRQINDMWSFGLKLKALIGFAGVHSNIDELILQTSMDRWQLLSIADAYIMTPAVKYSATNKSLSTDINAKNLFFPQGIGGAIDLGATYRPVENFTLSFAVTDLGLISWQNSSNIVNINTRGKFSFKGVEYHYRDNIDSLKSAYDRLVDNMKDSVKWSVKQGINGSINQWLTANANIGAEYGILDNKISFAAMANARINYNRIMPELTLGVNFRPADWAKFYLSHTLSTRCASTLGLGVNLQAGPVNFYIISDFVPLSYVKVQNFDKAIDNTIIPYRNNRFNVQTGLAFTFGSSKDDDRDGYAECYHFDNQGWMAENTVTADGYTVNQNGAWTVNGVVQTRRIAKNTAASPSAYPKDAYENEVLNRINQYRAGRGLRPCRENEVLDNFAEKRARECAILFSHTRPQGGTILSESQVCGEILACNLRTPESAVSAWRKSPKHNRVMLRHDFVSFGTGHYTDSSGNEYSVVLFSFYN